MQPLQQFVIKDGQIMEVPAGSAATAPSTGMSSVPIYLGLAMVFCMVATGFGGYWYGKFNVLDQMVQNGGRVGASTSGGNAGNTSSGGAFNLQSAASDQPKAPKPVRQENKRSEKSQQANSRSAPAPVAANVPSRAGELATEVGPAPEGARNQAKDAAGNLYEVRSGDTLGQIANRVYGDPSQFPRLFEANPRVLSSPDNLVPGQVLRVPD